MTGSKEGRVVAGYLSEFPDPIVVRAGQKLRIEDRQTEWPGWIWCMDDRGKGGWIPEAYIDRNEGIGFMRRDYDATELTVEIGEKLIVEGEESGWARVKASGDRRGWVPMDKIEIL